MKENFTVNHRGEELTAIFYYRAYDNGQHALQLTCEDGCPYMTASVRIGAKIPDNCMAIKNYSENEGIVESLQDAGFIGREVVTSFDSGFVSIPVYSIIGYEED